MMRLCLFVLLVDLSKLLLEHLDFELEFLFLSLERIFEPVDGVLGFDISSFIVSFADNIVFGDLRAEHGPH